MQQGKTLAIRHGDFKIFFSLPASESGFLRFRQFLKIGDRLKQ
jgi:hypothetical protein